MSWYPMIRPPVILSGKHAVLLARFLARRAESSLVLLANSMTGGLEDRGEPFQGTYAASIERGRITGVAAHYWNGMVFLQAEKGAKELFASAVATSGRRCAGIAGPYVQVQEVLETVLPAYPTPALNGREILFSLSLDNIVVPDLLKKEGISCRFPTDDEVEAVIAMRIAFMREHVKNDTRKSLEEEAREMVVYQHGNKSHWVLEDAGSIVATTAFNASIPGMVQVGGVYTFPDFRNRGYGRAVVAGALLEARARGVKKAILFTGEDMEAATRVYKALGFSPIGEYGLVIF